MHCARQILTLWINLCSLRSAPGRSLLLLSSGEGPDYLHLIDEETEAQRDGRNTTRKGQSPVSQADLADSQPNTRLRESGVCWEMLKRSGIKYQCYSGE